VRFGIGTGLSFAARRNYIAGVQQELDVLRPEARVDGLLSVELHLGGIYFSVGVQPYFTVWHGDVSAWRCGCLATELESYESDYGAAFVLSLGANH
jgi:hypothetical protein